MAIYICQNKTEQSLLKVLESLKTQLKIYI